MKKTSGRKGFVFKPYESPNKTSFEKLFEVFQELITHTSGDLDEAMEWLDTLDKEYGISEEDYTMDDFLEELKKRGYIKEEIKPDGNSAMSITAKTERAIRKNALDKIFGKIKKTGSGNHGTKSNLGTLWIKYQLPKVLKMHKSTMALEIFI
jgi:Ca-activated chloride channel family protein